MPAVPTYGGPQVQRNRLDTPFQRPIDVSSGLAAVGRGLTDASGALEKVAIRDAELEVNKVDREVTNGWLEWDAENKNKYQGENAGQYAVDAKKWWDDAAAKYGESVSSPLARQQLGPSLGSKRVQAMGGVLNHVAVTKERHLDSTYAAAQEANINFGVTTGNPAGVVLQMRGAIAELGKRKGWTKSEIEDEERKQLGTLHLAYIDKIAPINAEAAQQYYNKANERGEIPSRAQARAEQVLTAEADNQAANQFAAEQVGKPYEEQIAAWRASDAPAPRKKKMLEQIQLNQGLKDAGERERQKKASDEAWQAAASGVRAPERTLAQMDGHDRANLDNWVAARAERLAKGLPVVTNPDVHAGLYELARDDPQTFAKLSLIALKESLAPADLEQIATMQRDMLDPTKQRETLTWSQQMGASVKGMKAEQAGLFQSAANAEIVAFANAHNRQPNQSERAKMLNDLLVEGVLSRRWWFDEKKPAWKMDAEERQRARFPNATVEGVAPGGSPVVVPGAAPKGLEVTPNSRRSSGKVSSVGEATSRWQPQVQKAAAAKGVDPGIMLAQIDVESSGNPNAVGPETAASGTAKGLAQFTDATAKQYGVNQMDPQSSINGQAAYMGDLLKKYEGDYGKALAAYNWGPGNLDKLLKTSPSQWQEKLPAETKKYVAEVAKRAGRTPAAAPTDKFAAGKVYTDAEGRKALYLGNNQWKNL